MSPESSESQAPQEQPAGSNRRAFSGRESLGSGFPQMLHDRSRAKGSELHKTLLGFCTATLGVYFIALTGEIKPGLSAFQRTAATCGLLIMAVGSLSGLAGMLSDSRRNYFWACALQATRKEQERRQEMYRRRDLWWQIERILDRLLVVAFVAGVLSSLVYMVLRILAR